MAKKYCKYTKEQLQEYCNDESYCVKCVDSTMHIGLPPWGLRKFNETVRDIVSAEKLNRFDSKLNGIVLDIQSIKVVGEQYAVRNDSSALHVSLNVKFYVFQPRIGAVLLGIVKHVALHHISVTIHRFFNVVIPIEVKNSALKTNVSVMVKLTKFDLDDSIPYFEGKLEEILWQDQKEHSSGDSGVSTTDSTKIVQPVKVKREQKSNGRTGTDSDTSSDSDSDNEIPEPKIKREIKDKSSHSHNGTIVAKVKQEPVSSSESSASDSGLPNGSGKSTNKSSPTPKLPIKLKKEKRSSSSSSSDDSDSAAHTNRKKRSTTQTLSNGKRKHESGSSIIGRSLKKMSVSGKDKSDSSSSSSSSSSDNETHFFKNAKNNSAISPSVDTSFASPGLSSTRIAKTTKKKAKVDKGSGTNDFLKKMMSRFDK